MTFSTVSPESRVPAGHPIRAIKELADATLADLSPIFDEMYSSVGRPSIPPERLLKGSLLMALYSVRSERQFCERLDYDLLFRFFLGMNLDEPSFDATSFTKNRDRDVLRGHGGGREAAGNPTVNFHGEKRSNVTHESTTDPESRLYKKGDGQPARLCYSVHVLMENRNGLCVDIRVAEASGFAERREALAMIDEQQERGVRVATVGADKAYDTTDFVADLRERGVTPPSRSRSTKHRGSKIDARTDTRATPSANESESSSRRSSAG